MGTADKGEGTGIPPSLSQAQSESLSQAQSKSLSQALAEFRAITAVFGAGGGDAGLDDRLAWLETRLITGGIVSAGDLRAKAGYLADCAALDPALIPAAAVATLVDGIDVLFPP